MMKMAGALLIIGMTSIWGILKAENTKRQLENMKELQRIISMIQSEIRYSKAFLGEIFENIGQGVREPFRSWLLEMSRQTNSFTGKSLGDIWQSSVEINLDALGFPVYIFESLKQLGNQLGYADVQVQMRLLDLYQEHLERTIREMHDQVQTKVRLYHCLGVMSGLFVAVLLF